MSNRAVLTGSQGFAGSAIAQQLLAAGYEIIGIDNESKYGPVIRSHTDHPNFKLYKLNLIDDIKEIRDIIIKWKPNFIINVGAVIGGIGLFHKRAYDIIKDNPKIDSNMIDLSLDLHKMNYGFNRLVLFSSSMIYEGATEFPSSEDSIGKIPSPISTYGFSKLSTIYLARGASEQYELPWVILIPFNLCGTGEAESVQDTEDYIGTHKMLMSHIIPDLIYRALKSKASDTLTILGQGNQIRHYTHLNDLARMTVASLTNPNVLGQAINISNDTPWRVDQIANKIWNKIHGCDVKLEFAKPYPYDVQVRSPCTDKMKRLFNDQASIPVDQSIDEVIEWTKQYYKIPDIEIENKKDQLDATHSLIRKFAFRGLSSEII